MLLRCPVSCSYVTCYSLIQFTFQICCTCFLCFHWTNLMDNVSRLTLLSTPLTVFKDLVTLAFVDNLITTFPLINCCIKYLLGAVLQLIAWCNDRSEFLSWLIRDNKLFNSPIVKNNVKILNYRAELWWHIADKLMRNCLTHEYEILNGGRSRESCCKMSLNSFKVSEHVRTLCKGCLGLRFTNIF